MATAPTSTDARMAVETLARRADGVMHFVESYRQISRAPEVRRRRDRRRGLGQGAGEPVPRQRPRPRGSRFSLAVDGLPALEADPDLMSQVLINLIRNAAQAASGHGDAPQVWLTFSRTRSGRAQIEVADNGPGVPDALKQDIFLPFFTTKAGRDRRRPQPRPPGRARPSRLDQRRRPRGRRRPVPDRALKGKGTRTFSRKGTCPDPSRRAARPRAPPGP